MTPVRWKVLAIALAVAAAVLVWQNRRLSGDRARAGDTAREDNRARRDDGAMPPPTTSDGRARDRGDGDLGADLDGNPEGAPPPGFKVSGFLAFFQPRPGESMFDYRDRVLPIVQAAAAPHRRRVQSAFDDFADAAGLRADQRDAIEDIVARRAGAVQDRIMQGVLSGEVMPPNLTPSSGVAFAHDLLGELDGANRDVRGLLSAGQLDALDASRFDVVDYLVFSTRWEDMLGVVE